MNRLLERRDILPGCVLAAKRIDEEHEVAAFRHARQQIVRKYPHIGPQSLKNLGQYQPLDRAEGMIGHDAVARRRGSTKHSS